MHKGFIPPTKIETREEGAEHVLGTSTFPGIVINPTGDWLPYAFERESQAQDGVETYACSVHDTINQIENAIFKATGIKTEYSKRYVANVAVQKGILDPHAGANPHDILELMRNVTGMLLEGRFPWNDAYYTVDQKAMAQLLLEGPAWYKDWTLNHLWLWTTPLTPVQKRAKIQEALTKGTVCVSVYAWVTNNTGIYFKPQGAVDEHWTGIVQASGDTPYLCHDSYDPFIKQLDPYFDFGFGKVIFVTPRVSHLFLKNLSYSMSDPEVVELQRALISLGYPIPHATTPYFGTETRTALWQFQVSQGIADNGTHFGPQSRYALNRALNPKGSLGDWATFIRTILGV